jgi:hypothetical protein
MIVLLAAVVAMPGLALFWLQRMACRKFSLAELLAFVTFVSVICAIYALVFRDR